MTGKDSHRRLDVSLLSYVQIQDFQDQVSGFSFASGKAEFISWI
jgi:hypothetical protein